MENVKKDTTRGKIILFAMGVLVGAVISAAAFLIAVNVLGTDNNSMQMNGGEAPSGMPTDQNGQGSQTQPPEKPSGENS